MTIQELGSLGEFVGAIGVIVTLIYLAIQIRQNTAMLKQQSLSVTGAAETEGAAETLDIYLATARDASLASLIYKGIRSFEALTQEERFRFSAYWHGCFMTHQNFYLQHLRGALSDKAWGTYSRNIDQYMRLSGVIEWWSHGARAVFDEDFQAYIDAKVPASRLEPVPSSTVAK